ncbi:type 1 fimbrial protein (plasmid) [Hafnia alvei]|nr:type 1 fimbrial protein [Hafnia alvei]
MGKLNTLMYLLMLGICTQSFAASEVGLTVQGKINEGTCTLAIDNGAITLEDIDSSNTSLNDITPTKAKEFTLTVSDCSPGLATHRPALLFSGPMTENMWREPRTIDSANNAGEAYGIIINEKTNLLACEKTNGKSILDGHCDLGGPDVLLGNETIKMAVGYGKIAKSSSVSTGSIKSSIKISFVYH